MWKTRTPVVWLVPLCCLGDCLAESFRQDPADCRAGGRYMCHRGVDCNFQLQHGVSLEFAECCPCDSLARAKVNYLANEAVEDTACVRTCSSFSDTFS